MVTVDRPQPQPGPKESSVLDDSIRLLANFFTTVHVPTHIVSVASFIEARWVGGLQVDTRLSLAMNKSASTTRSVAPGACLRPLVAAPTLDRTTPGFGFNNVLNGFPTRSLTYVLLPTDVLLILVAALPNH